MILKKYYYIILNIFTYLKALWFKSLSNYFPKYILKEYGDNNYYIQIFIIFFDIDYLLSAKYCVKIFSLSFYDSNLFL